MSSGIFDPELIKSIPLAVLKTIPAGQPPPGINPNFADPPTRVPIILGICAAFLVLAVICFVIRIYTKLAVAKKWTWDDLTCSLGFMCSIVHFAAVAMGCIYGAGGRHLWDIYLDKVLNKYSTYQSYITTIMVTPALGLIKFSLFLQYYSLFRPLRWIRISVWIGGTICVVFYVAVTITAFVLNSPWPGESLQDDILSWHYHKFAEFSIPTGVVGMLVDWYLLILPIPAVWALRMSTSKKLGVLIVFMTGGLAAIASILSMNYRVELQNNPSDPTWKVGYVLLWSEVEMFGGVAASSMPTVHLFFTGHRFSLGAKWSCLKSILTHSPTSTSKEKLRDGDPSLTDWGRNSTHTWQEHQGTRRNDLESAADEEGKTPWLGNSHIRLTQDISITQEPLNGSSFRPPVTDRHW